LSSGPNPQFGADLFDKGSNYPHSQSFTIGRIKTLWQTGAVIGNCQRVALLRIEFQSDRYPAGTVLDCVRDQFAGNETEGDAGGCKPLRSNNTFMIFVMISP
jgi:hypothetical protein